MHYSCSVFNNNKLFSCLDCSGMDRKQFLTVTMIVLSVLGIIATGIVTASVLGVSSSLVWTWTILEATKWSLALKIPIILGSMTICGCLETGIICIVQRIFLKDKKGNIHIEKKIILREKDFVFSEKTLQLIDGVKKYLENRFSELAQETTIHPYYSIYSKSTFNENTLVSDWFPANKIDFSKNGIRFSNIEKIIASERPSTQEEMLKCRDQCKYQGRMRDFYTRIIYDDCNQNQKILLVSLVQQQNQYLGFPFPETAVKKLQKLNFSKKHFSGIDASDVSVSMQRVKMKNASYSEKYDVGHFEYFGWKDHQVISLQTLQALVQSVEGYIQDLANDSEVSSSKKVRLIVYCNAGYGRTGVLLCALAIKKAIDQGLIKDDVHLVEKIGNIIFQLIKDRNPEMYYSKSQRCWVSSYFQYLVENKQFSLIVAFAENYLKSQKIK